MQAVSIILLLISVGTILGPIGGVVIMYRDNLPALIVSDDVNNLIGDNGILSGDNNGNNNNNNNNNGNNDNALADFNLGLLDIQLISYQIDAVARTFTVTVSVANNLNYDLTLNALSATVSNYQDNQQLASISLSSPVTIASAQTSQLTVAGTWTQTGENLITNGATTVHITLSNILVDVNGIVVQPSQAPDFQINIPQ
jgi:hypothetical protein